jgi:DNA-binding CsgD family transcriptional regulator
VGTGEAQLRDEPEELDHLTGKLFQGGLTPERLPDVIVSLAAWLKLASELDPDRCRKGDALPRCPLAGSGSAENAPCRRRSFGNPPVSEDQCLVCASMDGVRPSWQRIVDLFMYCQKLREFAEQALSQTYASHVAAIILSPGGAVLDCDARGRAFISAGEVLRVQAGRLCCSDAALQPGFNAALREAIGSGRTSNILLHAPAEPDKRFSLTLARMRQRASVSDLSRSVHAPEVLCLVAPLDGRRVATAQQLMDFFGLSRAEARLARAICHGDSVEEYARDHGVGLPTVRTQLSSVFHKTGANRQAT